MLSSIARSLHTTDIEKIHQSPIPDQAKIIFRIAQSWWFGRELMHHPIAHHAAGQELDLNEIALAQHYGIPTGYLDLTDDFRVGAFFATCRETKNGWEPVDAGVGVIYRVHLLKLEDAFHRYIPLGPQPLPRPTEQCAWVTELPFRHAFEGWPCVEILPFHHDRRIGEHFLEMYAGGKLLFPRDPLADVAAEILACGEIPIDLVEAVLGLYASDPYGILSEHIPLLRQEISKLANQISYRALLTDQHVAALLTDQEWIDRMLSAVTARAIAVRRVYVPRDNTDHEGRAPSPH
jgi:hypothetical protein